jgi:hypothetical protein
VRDRWDNPKRRCARRDLRDRPVAGGGCRQDLARVLPDGLGDARVADEVAELVAARDAELGE